MLKDFRGRTAVVTGAANGIGAALARLAASQGTNVAIADVDTVALRRTEQAALGEEAERIGLYRG